MACAEHTVLGAVAMDQGTMVVAPWRVIRRIVCKVIDCSKVGFTRSILCTKQARWLCRLLLLFLRCLLSRLYSLLSSVSRVSCLLS